MVELLQITQTILTGGVFTVLLCVAWKGAGFVSMVRSTFTAVDVRLTTFERNNNASHGRIEHSISKVGKRVGVLEDDG